MEPSYKSGRYSELLNELLKKLEPLRGTSLDIDKKLAIATGALNEVAQYHAENDINSANEKRFTPPSEIASDIQNLMD